MRIGLVAMSGVRAFDKELMDFGLTLPGFVERSRVVASLPSLGLLTLAGMTPPDHEVVYREVADFEGDLSGHAGDAAFDLVAISSFSAQIGAAYALGDRFRERGVPVVMGGLHVSCLPDEAAAHCDAVVIGEGEVSWGQVLRDAEHGRLQPRYGLPAREFDLADAPMPAYELLDIEKYNRLTVQASRGCPHKCEFCASSILLTRGYKQKPAAKVLAEIDRICELWSHPFIEFADDNTFIHRAYWKELLPQLARRRVRWFTETDVSVAGDPELLEMMRESGCAQVLIGFESPTPSSLDGIEVRRNWKLRQWPSYPDAVRIVQGHGISVNGCFVLGLDAHGPEIFDQVFDFVEESGLHEVQITLQTPFPGTVLHQRLQEAGRLLEDSAWHKCTLFDVNFRPLGMSVEELRRGFRDLAARLYSDAFTRRRRRRFRTCLRTLRRAPSGPAD